ncbi:class I SAM-dependent methyltransferase [Guptibacillus algicola]|uniref:class I SAM-dependent methyltransferase n=1 Tax=Guptibacillus algicola TaxID=225844 RepID=UPI001CD1F1BD|nr:class I SAM-dependent methyltransferase [Alkalihalobacillus algicola]MCA0988694.1 class I SAM-dependent methyltransferase [Alkalihalobacillus algicola]
MESTMDIKTNADLMNLLDSLLREPETFWDQFYEDREKPIPFFKQVPDENLVSYLSDYDIPHGRVLEIGSGPGRNAIYLAKQGFQVDAVDLSQKAIDWGNERANEEEVEVNFIHSSLFDLKVDAESYDFIYDSGCFHHLAPHRRVSYLSFIKNALKVEGYFGLTCFVPEGPLGGAVISDREVYEQQTLHGGLGYSKERLLSLFNKFNPIEIREMRETQDPTLFGVNGLMTALFKK